MGKEVFLLANISGLPNEQYWQQRQLLLEKKRFKNTMDLERELDRIIQREVMGIENEINDFLVKFEKENQINYQSAIKELNKKEFAEYKNRIGALIEDFRKNPTPKTIEQIKVIQARRKVTRLQSLQDYLKIRSCNLSEQEIDLIETHLMNQYSDEYLENLYTLQSGTNNFSPFDIPSTEALEAIVNYPYSGDLFSVHVWSANEKMVNSLMQTLQTGMVRGHGIDKMARDFRKLLKDQQGVKYDSYSIKRILRTESSFIQEKANSDSMKEYGTERFVVIAAEDERMCKRCGAKHETKVKLEDEQLGINAPPFHPMCRCTKVADVLNQQEIDEINAFIDRRNIEYDEWKEKYGIKKKSKKRENHQKKN